MQNDQSRTHRGIAYSIVRSSEANMWCWQFEIGDQLKRGKTEARLPLLADRRVRMVIDRELKRLESETEVGPTPVRAKPKGARRSRR